MKQKKIYFSIFKETDIVFGFNFGIYPYLSIWIRLPYVEIRMGLSIFK